MGETTMKLATVLNEIRKLTVKRVGNWRARPDDVAVLLQRQGGRWEAQTRALVIQQVDLIFRARRGQPPEAALLGLLAMLREKE